VHQPRKDPEKRARVVKHKRTWTYEDENGQDLGQDYLELRNDDQEKNVSIRLFDDSHNNLI
jgi:hypothetical protein